MVHVTMWGPSMHFSILLFVQVFVENFTMNSKRTFVSLLVHGGSHLGDASKIIRKDDPLRPDQCSHLTELGDQRQHQGAPGEVVALQGHGQGLILWHRLTPWEIHGKFIPTTHVAIQVLKVGDGAVYSNIV